MSADRKQRIAAVLDAGLAPSVLRITDDSAHHAGHAGAALGGQTHYAVLVVSPAFAGQSRVHRSRTVHALLAREFGSGLHALSLVLRTPEEHFATET